MRGRDLLWVFVGCIAVMAAVDQVRAQSVTVSDLVVFSTAAFGNPTSTPAQGRDGSLYATIIGSNASPGQFFKFSSTGTTRLLYTPSVSSAYGTISGLTLGTDGNFYGVVESAAVSGGSQYGNLFKLTPKGTFTILHLFNGSTDGAFPLGAPIEATDGNLYGSTFGGTVGPSTIYKYTRAGQFSTIYVVPTAQGMWANSVLQGSDGNLYITCFEGGIQNNGTILKVSTSGRFLSYYAFTGGSNGSLPLGRLVSASDGSYYGTTYQGGGVGAGFGAAFRLTASGQLTVLHGFTNQGRNSHYPVGLIQATDGYLYGVTTAGGQNGVGTLYRLSTSGAYTDLYNFSTSVGNNVQGLMQDTSGLLYGSANQGSTNGYGAMLSVNLGLGPFVRVIEQSSSAGKTIEILGQGFTGTQSVTVNGLAASSFSVVNDTYLTAVVPTGATTGTVVVTTPTATLASNQNLIIH